MISLPILIVIGVVLAAGTGAAVYTYSTITASNQSPIISVEPINNATVGQTILVNATVSDPDGTILTTIWDQQSGPTSNFTQVGEDLYFTPSVNGSYLFSVEAQDDKQAITALGVLVNVKGSIVTPPVETHCEGNEVWNGEKCVCKDGYHQDETEACVINTPPPQPLKDIKAVVVGDVYDGTSGKAVYEQIKKQNADYVFVLGDIYNKVDWFKASYGSLGDKMWCVIGNHDADNEDGSAEVEKVMLEFCVNSYWIKYGGNLFLLYNTNDNQNTLIDGTKKVFSNSTITNGVKNVFVLGHKGCQVPPNSHHPAGEIKALCDYLKSNISVKAYYITAHNHVYSENKDKTIIQTGAGGKSHYTCGTNVEFPYCNNSSYGFVLLNIKADGSAVTSSFIDYNGVVKH